MIAVLLILLMILWISGANLRVYRQARFYQIEEYMSLRYLRWLLAARDRWFPNRAAGAWFIGSIMTFVLAESPGSPLPAILGILAAGVAITPPSETEIKKKFRATPRARRLLGVAFTLVTIIGLGLFFLLNMMGLPDRFLSLIISTLGFTVFIAAPLALPLANLLLYPVEAALRARFIQRARTTLAQVNPVVIGITGSYGKTTTKTILAHLLNGRYHAYPTPKSYNTLMGICIAINNDIANDNRVEYFIAEMGAYVPGEIKRICDLTHPRISIVIEVGPQHLERFGSLENTATAKYEIIKALPADGVGIFNWDNPYVRTMLERGYPATRLAISTTTDPSTVQNGVPRFVASDITESLHGLVFTVTDTLTHEVQSFSTPLVGAHNVTNILLATAVAVHEGVPFSEVAFRVRTLHPPESRLVRETTANGITIINDAYSANPVGAISALKVLSLHTSGRRLLITPGMVELGAMMESENRKLGVAAAAHATEVILVGSKQTIPINEGLVSAGFPAEHLHVVETLAEAIDWYQRNLTTGDSVLFLNDLPDTYSASK